MRAALDAKTRSLVAAARLLVVAQLLRRLRRARGPANLLQGLRDYFGAHTYRRLDAEGSFHTRWGPDGKEVPIR